MATTPLKAIREKCLDCCCYQLAEVRECGAERCPLYPFRMGKNPYRIKRQLSDEQKQALAQRLSKKRAEKQAKN